jgi:hypothetical protein
VTRSPRPSARRAAVEAAGHIERSDVWNGLRAGDPVIVSGLRVRGATWEFRAHVLNRKNGTESIEVVGGRQGDRTVRSFGPERIFAVTKKGRDAERTVNNRLSLADAPQLPLG